MRSLAIESLSVRGFRNLSHVTVALGPRFNVVSGDNGQGKTNLLESVYVLATSRSFRTSKLSELLGADEASVRASVREDAEVREQSVGLRSGVRAVRVDGKRPSTLASYALRTPVVVFHPGMLGLSAGSGAERRKLLDRVALHLGPASLADLSAYGRAARARQRVLEVRGERAPDLDGWEALMVRHGLGVSASREAAAARFAPAAVRAFKRIGPSELTLGVRYERSAPDAPDPYRELLAARRARDRARGSASVGPHRDDLALELSGRAVRGVASQGQHRAIVLALELGEIEVIAEASDTRPILLLDDVSSELDRDRTSALLATLGEGHGQVILTTTRPELVDPAGSFRAEERRDFTAVRGAITPTQGFR
jgi:DNA replication and repair protein RecF